MTCVLAFSILDCLLTQYASFLVVHYDVTEVAAFNAFAEVYAFFNMPEFNFLWSGSRLVSAITPNYRTSLI